MTDTEQHPSTVAIDYSAQPGIIDTIIAFASVPALAQLRATSRDLRDRIDRRLFHHVALLEWKKPDQPPSGLSKLFQRPSTEPRFTAAGLPTYVGPEVLFPRYPLVPSAVEILDIVHPIRVDSFDFDELTSVHTLRRMNYAVSTSGYIAPHVLVDFCYLYPRAWNDTKPIPLFPRAERYVLHLKWEEADNLALWNYFQLGHMETMTDFVLVLHPNPPEDGVSAVIAESYGLMDLLIATISVLDRAGTVTIVGLELVAPQQLSYHDDAPDEAGVEAYEPFRESLVEHLVYRVDHNIEGTDVALHRQDLLHHIRFVSLQDWLEDLGDRKELEGVWPSCADDEFVSVQVGGADKGQKHPQFPR